MNDIQRLERIYGAAGRELRRLVRSVEPQGYSELGARALMDRVRDITLALNVAVEQWSSTAIPKAYAKGARTARVSLEILGRTRKRMPVEDRARRLADDLLLILIRANNSIPATVERYLGIVALASRAVRTAQVQEFSFEEASRELGAMAAEAVTKSVGWLSMQVRNFLRGMIEDDEFIEINGRMYRMKKYADMVAQTALREAQTAATLDLCNQYENDLVVVSDHGCDCDLCEQYEGNIYSISGWGTRYPMLPAQTPFHPNCQHSLLPTSEEAISVVTRRRGTFESTLEREIREAEEAARWENVR